MGSNVTALNDMCPAANRAKLGDQVQLASSMGRIGNAGKKLFVDSVNGSNTKDGSSWDLAKSTIQAAVDLATDYSWIFITGRFDESVVTPAWDASVGAENVKIVGMDGGPGDYVNAPEWRSGGSGEDALIIRSVGWSVERVKFRVPVNAAAIKLLHRHTDADAYDASSPNFSPNFYIHHNWFYGGGTGLYGIEMWGMPYYGSITGNYFSLLASSGNARCIKCLSSSWAAAREIHILGNHFAESDGYVDFSVGGINAGHIHGNTFQVQNAYNSDPKLDLSGGFGENLVSGNWMGGSYTTADGYVPATGDDWAGNFSMHVGATGIGDNGISVAVPTS